MFDYTSREIELSPSFEIRERSIEGAPPRHVLICIHGIRDDGSFSTRVDGRFLDTEIEIVGLRFERVSTLDFLCDTRLEDVVDDIAKQMLFVVSRFPGSQFSVLAHSFGTKVLALVLARLHFEIEWIFLCSSVARISDVEALHGNDDRRLVNDACTRDRVPILAEITKPAMYQATGVYGFHKFPVEERCFDYDHADSISRTHIVQWVLPALANRLLPQTEIRDWKNKKNTPVYVRRAVLPFLFAGQVAARLMGLCRRRKPA